MIVARRPDAIFRPQFYAEDGSIWFADAYNYGWWHVLLSPYEGYLHLILRLSGGIALLVPVSRAPLLENLIAIALYAFPISLLLSSRSAPWGSFKFRALLASLYLLLPNTHEMIATVSDCEWIVALSALLLLVALPPRTAIARVMDLTIFGLFCLTGPFCGFLLPVALWRLWRTPHSSWERTKTGVLLLGCLIQGIALVRYASVRPNPFLGATPEWFARLLGGQVYLATLLGGNGLALYLSTFKITSVAVAGTMLVVLCALRAPAGMRALIFLSSLLFMASLATPNASPPKGMGAWMLLAGSQGSRYWFLQSLAFAWSLAYCARSSSRIVQRVAVCLLIVMSIGIVRDFRYPAYPDLTSPEYATRLEAAHPGTVISIPLNPRGWTMRLIKH